jgi:hypothetical protein
MMHVVLVMMWLLPMKEQSEHKSIKKDSGQRKKNLFTARHQTK